MTWYMYFNFANQQSNETIDIMPDTVLTWAGPIMERIRVPRTTDWSISSGKNLWTRYRNHLVSGCKYQLGSLRNLPTLIYGNTNKVPSVLFRFITGLQMFYNRVLVSIRLQNANVSNMLQCSTIMDENYARLRETPADGTCNINPSETSEK